MIAAEAADLPAIETFLKSRIATSMFPLSNLRRYGMAGGHPRAMRFWLGWKDGHITDALGMSEEGFVFPQCPGAPWGEAAVVLSGRPIKGILGQSDQVAALRRVLALDPDATALDTVDPLFTLTLTDLIMPNVADFALVPLTEAHRAVATAWRAAYIQEVMPIPGEDPASKAAKDIAMYISGDTHRILLQGETPVAFTGFNADLPEAVQIGGVYVPPALRKRGLARRAVALHLAEARARGTKAAILFAASETAARAYTAVGFRRAGDFSLLVYETPQVAHV